MLEPYTPSQGLYQCLEVPPPRETSELKAKLVGIALDGDMEILELSLPLQAALEDPSSTNARAFVVLDGNLPGPASVAVHDARLQSLSTKSPTGTGLDYDARHANLFIRRSRSQHGTPVVGSLYFLPEYRWPGGDNLPARILRFTSDARSEVTPNPAILERWLRALLTDLNLHQDAATHWSVGPNSSAWQAFAGERLIERYLRRGKARAQGKSTIRYPDQDPRSVIDQTIDVMSGAHSLYGALRNAEAIGTNLTGKPWLSLAKLEPPAMRTHAFADMLARLGGKVPEEPLAQAAPAEFWYLRSSDVAALFDLVERVDAWGSPAVRLMGQGGLSRNQLDRYSAELGLLRSEVSKLFGPALIEAVALVGSDAYIAEGSDVSLIFALKSPTGFRQALSLSTALSGKQHGGSDVQRREYLGVEVTQTESKDRALHQFVAIVGSRAVVSNSWAAMRRIIDTLGQRHAALVNEPDFRFMLARDASIPAPILVYLSDRFIAETAGPRQRILESRRVRALAELLTPAFGAMLYGYLEGRSPSSTKELLRSGLLEPAELRHFDAAAITFEPGSAPRSIYGTPAAATPLIEFEAPVLVTRAEAEAYRRWAAEYSRAWSGTIDPVALRLMLTVTDTEKLTADMRVLPLIADSEYQEYLSIVGAARATAEPTRDGLRLLMALDRDASWRRSLNRELRPDAFVKDLSFDIIGDWAMLGVSDHPAATEVLQRTLLGRAPCAQARESSQSQEFSQIPAHAGIAIANVGAAALALTAIHHEVKSTFGDQLAWDSIGKERGVTITRVRLKIGEKDHSQSQSPPIYFALLKDAFYVATEEATLRRLMVAHLDGKGPRAGRPNDSAPNQVTLDLAPRDRGAFADFLLDMVELAAVRAAWGWTSYADALFRGVPELVAQPTRFSEVALAYLGAVPTIDGDVIEGYGPEGVILKHGGTAIRPKPPAGRRHFRSLFENLIRARASVAFELEQGTPSEPPARSLHTRVELEYKR